LGLSSLWFWKRGFLHGSNIDIFLLVYFHFVLKRVKNNVKNSHSAW